jgi:hypothetical protein
MVEFEFNGQKFSALNGGLQHTFNEAISMARRAVSASRLAREPDVRRVSSRRPSPEHQRAA